MEDWDSYGRKLSLLYLQAIPSDILNPSYESNFVLYNEAK